MTFCVAEGVWQWAQTNCSNQSMHIAWVLTSISAEFQVMACLKVIATVPVTSTTSFYIMSIILSIYIMFAITLKLHVSKVFSSQRHRRVGRLLAAWRWSAVSRGSLWGTTDPSVVIVPESKCLKPSFRSFWILFGTCREFDIYLHT